MSTSIKNVYALGASRNIGYFAALRLLAKGVHITFLLRSPATFESDPAILPYLPSKDGSKQGQIRIVKGDATNADDVKRGWETALQNGEVDLVLFTVGGAPRMTLTHGAVIDPPNLCTHSILNVLTTMPTSISPPRIIAITSIGTTHDSHGSLPFLFKPFYSTMLAAPHRDKIGYEKILGHVSGKLESWGYAPDSNPDGDDLPGGILSKGWKKLPGLPAVGAVPRVVSLRPALLVDGECRADEQTASGKSKSKGPYRVQEGDLKNPYTISRKDTAHFIVEGLLANWEQWEGKCVSIAY